MNDGIVWLVEHLSWVFFAAYALFGALAVLAARSAWRRSRQRPRRWPGVVVALVGFVVGAGGLALTTAAFAGFGLKVIAQERLVGAAAPPFAYRAVADDSPGSLAQFRGRPVVLNIWATWCPPCRAEMADLAKLQTAHAEDGLVVLQISDEPRATIQKYLAESPMPTVHGYVSKIPWTDSGRPMTFLIDQDGTVRKVIVGARGYEQFERDVARHLL